MALNTTSNPGFLTSMVIGDAQKKTGYSNDLIPPITKVNIGGVQTPINAALEIQSTTGALVIPRLTNAQETALTAAGAALAADGSMIYNTELLAFRMRQNGAWASIGIAAGEIIGPGVTVVNTLSAWSNITGTALRATSIGLSVAGTELLNTVGAVALPSYSFTGLATHGMWSRAAGEVNFSTTNGEQFRILDGGALTVNRAQVAGSATGLPVAASAIGTDANIGFSISSKGNLPVFIPNGFNLGLGASFAAADTNTLLIQAGTAPVAGVASAIKLYAAAPALPVGSQSLGIYAGTSPITVVGPTAPNRTLAVVVNGTTYYLHCKTTND